MKSLKITLLLVFAFATQLLAAQEKPALVDPVTNCKLRYYYYPNLEAYFDVQEKVFHFMQKGQWVTAPEIPNGYRGYSIYNKCNVAITDFDDDDPTQMISHHKKQYPYTANGKIKNMMAASE